MRGADHTLDLLRDAAWLHPRRARAYLVILAAVSALAAVAYLALSRHGLDPWGKPLGTDFASFWTASRLALDGEPAAAWNVEAHRALQARAFGARAGYAAFFYPPTFLLACLPLALAPYLPALAAWLIATGAAFAATVRAWLGREAPWLAIAAFPAVFVNAGHGQNGFLTAALFGAAARVVERRPWLGGALFGLLAIKPHLAVLVPPYLLFTRNGRGFVAAGLSAAGLCLLSAVVLGVPAWAAFAHAAPLARTALEQNLLGYAKLSSVFAGARLLHAPIILAWIVQTAVAAVAVALLWRARRGGLGAGAALACATLLTTPFLFDYDLTLLAVPLAWLFVQARRGGFLPWERLALLAGYVLPLMARPLAMGLGVPLTPLVVLGLLACVVRRARAAQL